MNNFFKQVLAVIVGLTIFQIIAVAITIIFIFSVASGLKNMTDEDFASTNPLDIEDHSVLWIDLNYNLPERDGFTSFDLTSASDLPSEVVGLQTVLNGIEYAATDDQIEGIYLNLSILPEGFSSIDALRRSILKFKESGKFVIAYGEVITQKAYYLASVADKIYLNPKGVFEMRGIGTQLTFFNKLITEKLGAEVQVFKVGTFKSAVEPFLLDKASEANKEQIQFLLNGINYDFIGNIAKERGLDQAYLNAAINDLKINNPNSAIAYGLVDELKYYDEVLDELAERTETAEDEDFEYVKLADYAKAKSFKKNKSDNKIAVIYAEGSIVDGKGEENNIGGEKFAALVRELRQDDEIKAIVLRINSGGGSALASEVMWREFELASQEKPFVVSMGDVAASGGYYIACNADRIYAEENTITGSIGVFGIIPNLENFFEDKMGVTFDNITVHDHAASNGVTKGFDEVESLVIQASVEEVYATFTTRVAEGRNLPLDSVLKYGEGRVWTGEQGLDIGLVDELGSLSDAIVYASELADLENFKTVNYPKIKGPLESLLSDIGGQTSTKILKNELGPYYKYVEQIKDLEEMQHGVQARIPFAMELY